jgi:hypothetical protein
MSDISGLSDVGAQAKRGERKRSSALLVYLLLFVSLQIFLLVVAVEGLQADDPGLARAAAILSVVLFMSTIGLRWFVGDR